MTEIWLLDVGRSGPALAELERDAPRLTAEDRRRANALKDRFGVQILINLPCG